eukprot:scpid40541/ scgid16571/ 
MDIHVRFWSEDASGSRMVFSRFYGSEFLGHATAQIMLTAFLGSCNPLGLQNLLQVSMDGPNVNWRFFKLLQEDLKSGHGNCLLDIGSCGLHIVHGAFGNGAGKSGWNVNKLLSCLHYLFKDSPARRADFTLSTESEIFPMKFCAHRWLENVPVVKRAIEVSCQSGFVASILY